MIQYTFYQKNPHAHYVYIDLLIDTNSTSLLELQLPAWRPGRYELGNFAKNVKRLDVFNDKNEALSYTKLNKEVWLIDTKNSPSVKVTYSYYAAELNAGACFANAEQMYINPIQCCLQVKGQESTTHKLIINVPDNYRLVSSLKSIGKELYASNYDELVDSPFIASASIQSDFYESHGIKFHLHFCGYCQPNFEKIKQDFIKFTEYQIQFWGDFPVNEYHFLFQITPHKFYHGVEHQKNTVIAIGPGYALHEASVYEDVLGVSSHELFHTWNIKYIRPQEMLPYDYSKENYARTGYVYEGFTTYYGDKHLLCSEVFTNAQYFSTLEERLIKHFNNYGRYNLSVAHSSWETWLDGYVSGAPYRKTNIYDEGCLIAFMLDVEIMKASGNKRSLKDVCRKLYTQYGKLNKGYGEQDVIKLVNEEVGYDMTSFFDHYVYTPNDFELGLQKSFDYLGIQFRKNNNANVCEDMFGFKVAEVNGYTKVQLVAPYSPSWKRIVRGNLQQWLTHFKEEDSIVLTVVKQEALVELLIQKDKKGNTWFADWKLELKKESTEEQKQAFNFWKTQ
jgi:predicted metalloprotease with PDZ domain